MIYEWDALKNQKNLEERGIPFTQAENFEWDGALLQEDKRRDYGEKRFQAMGMIEGKLHVLVYTNRGGRVRVISLRRANQREERLYEKNK